MIANTRMRRVVSGTLMVAGAGLMMFAPPIALGLIPLAIGLLLEAAGVVIEHERGKLQRADR